MAHLDENTNPDNMPRYGEPRDGGNIDTSMEAARESTQADANNLGTGSGAAPNGTGTGATPDYPEQIGTMSQAGQPSAGGSETRLGNLGGGTPGVSGQTTNMDAAGAIERSTAGANQDAVATGSSLGQGPYTSSGSTRTDTGNASTGGTDYEIANDRMGSGGYSIADDQMGTGGYTIAGPGTDTPRRGGDAAPNRDNVMGEATTASTNNDITGTAAARGAPDYGNRPASTVGNEHTGVPSGTDPETELLDPGYTPQAGSGTERGAAGEQGTSGSPGRPGMPNQAGTLDQTTYTSQSDTLGSDAGMGQGGGLG